MNYKIELIFEGLLAVSKMLRSFKVKLIPNNRRRTRLFQFAGTACSAYNRALRKEIDAYPAGEKFISNFDL